MNKLFTKIGTAMVGIAMAIGVGVAVGRDGAKEVRAADPVAGDAPNGSAGNWTPIEAAGDAVAYTAENKKLYMLGFEYNDETYYATGAVSSNALQFTTTFKSAKLLKLATKDTGFSINFGTDPNVYFRPKADSTKVETSTAAGNYYWTFSKITGSGDLFAAISSYSDRYLARTSTTNTVAKIYSQGSGGGVDSRYPLVTLYKYVDSIPDEIERNDESFDVTLGKNYNLNGCVTQSGTSDTVYTCLTEGYTEYFTIDGNTVTPIKVGGPFTIKAKKGTPEVTFEINIVLPETKIIVDGDSFETISKGSYGDSSFTYQNLNNLNGGMDSSVAISINNAMKNTTNIQMKSGYVKNTTAVPGHIKYIEITFNTNVSAPSLYANTNSEASTDSTKITVEGTSNVHRYDLSNKDYRYFYLSIGSTTMYFSMEIRYEKSNATQINDFATLFTGNLATACADENANNKDALTAVQASSKTLWAEQKEAFEALPSAVKSLFVENSADAKVVQAVKLYKHCVARYGLATWTGAPEVQAAANIGGYTTTNNSYTLIIVVSAVVLVTLAGTFFLTKKKKD